MRRSLWSFVTTTCRLDYYKKHQERPWCLDTAAAAERSQEVRRSTIVALRGETDPCRSKDLPSPHTSSITSNLNAS